MAITFSTRRKRGKETVILRFHIQGLTTNVISKRMKKQAKKERRDGKHG